MERKLIDVLNDLEMCDVEFYQLLDEEIDELVECIDLEKVQQLAVTHRERTVLQEIVIKEETPRKQHKKINKWLLCAALATMLISGTIIAKQSMNKFAYFLGEDVEIPEGILVDMNYVQSADAIQMKVNQAMVSGDIVTLMMSFTQKDGEPFNEGVLVEDMSIHWDGCTGAAIEYELVEDRTELLCSYRVYGNRKVEGEKMVIRAKNIYARNTIEEEMNIPLDKIYKKHPIEISYKRRRWSQDIMCQELEADIEKQKALKPVVMPLEEEYPEIQFDGVSFVDGRLILTIQSDWTEQEKILGDENNIRTEAEITKVRDIRNNKIYEAHTSGYGYLDETEQAKVYYSEFKGITVKDLPYIKPIVTYDIEELVFEGEWEQEVIIEGGEQGFSKVLSEESQYRIDDVQLEEINLSSMGVTLTGKVIANQEENKQVFDPPIISVRTVDQGMTTLDNIYAGDEEGKITWRYKMSETELIDTRTVLELYINKWEVMK